MKLTILLHFCYISLELNKGGIVMSEQNKRINILKEKLVEDNIDLAIITDPANVFYFTGFNSEPHERFMAFIFEPKNDKYTMFVPALDKEAAKRESVINEVIPISDEEDPFEILSEHINNDIQKIAVETGYMSMFRHQELQNIFPKATYENIEEHVNVQRLNKSRQEIEYLQDAVNIIEKVLTEGIKKVKVGMTELELAGEFELLMKKFGAVGPSFSTIVLSGEKSALPHGVPDERAFEKGDFLLIDFGVITKNGYCSDIVGEATDKQKEIYDIVRASNQAGIDAVKAGVALKNFDLDARKVIDDKGYGQYFNNRIGHGLGIEVHEAPSIHEKNEQIAQPGLFFTIEPGIYIPGYGGVRIEDEVYINEDGESEILTSFPKELQIL